MKKIILGSLLLSSLTANALEWSSDIIGRVPSAVSPLEIDGSVPNGAVVVGMGFRGVKGKVTTMKLSYAYINVDGTMGPTYDRVFGSSPGSPLEVEADCGNSEVITRVALRFTDNNVGYMELDCSAYNSTTMSVNSYVSQILRSSFDGRYSPEMEWAIHDHAASNFERSFLTGFGVRENNDNFTNLVGHYKVLNP